jgi:hypothetical protein
MHTFENKVDIFFMLHKGRVQKDGKKSLFWGIFTSVLSHETSLDTEFGDFVPENWVTPI